MQPPASATNARRDVTGGGAGGGAHGGEPRIKGRPGGAVHDDCMAEDGIRFRRRQRRQARRPPDAAAVAVDDDDGGDDVARALEVKLLQRIKRDVAHQASRAGLSTAQPKQGGPAPVASAGFMNFGQSFQTTRGEVAVVDEHLEKYIQRRLQDIQGDGSEVGDRDPSTKKRVRPGPDIEFSGIQEYSLPLDERLRKREAIEKAKREFVEDRCADADRVDVRTIPSNVGSNFNLHIAAPDDGTTGIAAESGGPTDQVVYDQFRKKHARTRR